MYGNWNHEMKMVSIMVVLLIAFASATDEKAASSDNSKEISNDQNKHIVAKRAWQQLQGGWGKRSNDEEPNTESLEELQRKILKLYSDHLLENQVESADDDYDMDGEVSKRAWQKLQGSWGKRDWR